ncbi:hypothetical protein [Mycoplasma sp. 4423]
MNTIKNIKSMMHHNSKFIFTLHNMFSTKEYTQFWMRKHIYKLPLFSKEKILTNIHYDTKIKNRFYTPDDIKTLMNQNGFIINELFNRDDRLEPRWVLNISTNCTFYICSLSYEQTTNPILIW